MSLSPPLPSHQSRYVARWWPAAIVFLQFFLYSAIQAPVPAVNEPHYLGKAKHLWDPAWAEGDFFLESSNPHLFFYLSIGWLTRFFSLEATAWISRIVAYGFLAVGWTLLARRIAGSGLAAVLSAATFLLLASIGNFSGEWLVGGVEGKVFSYALLLAGIALWIDRRVNLAAICLGTAVSFHPVVGAWGILCVAIAEWGQHFLQSDPTEPGRISLKQCATPFSLLLLTALPGLLPALLSLGGSSPAETVRANYIQVFIRLAHHLDPTTFGAKRFIAYFAMLAAWLGIWKFSRARRSPAGLHPDSTIDRRTQDWFRLFILSTVAIAVVGVAIGWHSGSAWNMPLRNLRTTLLKFYPFRLADIFVPLALSLATAKLLASPSAEPPRLRLRMLAIIAAAILIFAVAISIPQPSRNPSRMTPQRFAAWTDVAQWLQKTTPPNTLLVTPTRQWGFRWYSGRALFVDYKDAPQDTAGLLEWERRLDLVRNWWQTPPIGSFSESDLMRLGEQTNAHYLVTLASPLRFNSKPLYDNGTYRVYALR